MNRFLKICTVAYLTGVTACTIIHRIFRRIRDSLSIINKKAAIAFHCSYKWYGNNYGGFYICPEMIPPPPPVIYSIGIGEDISFDEAILKDYDCKIYAFDPTPKSIEWIGKQTISDDFKFFPYGVSNKTEEKRFYLPKNKEHISGSVFSHKATSNTDYITVQMKRLEDIASENQYTWIDVLKMDIEGSEFQVIEDIPYNKISFGQILIEFHERFIKNGKHLLKRSIKTLKENGYYCFAIAQKGSEYSFINKKEYEKKLNERFAHQHIK